MDEVFVENAYMICYYSLETISKNVLEKKKKKKTFIFCGETSENVGKVS